MAPRPLLLDPAGLRHVLDQRAPQTIAGPRAAVAVVARRSDDDTELLFIQRATKPTDPWSGQMAFPGGRIDPGDADTFAAAERETREEVGLDLGAAERLGSLDDLDGGRARTNLRAVSAHAYWLDGPRPTLTNNHEVAASLWVPVGDLADPQRHIDYFWPPSSATWPGVQLDEPNQVIWGMTLRFLANLFARLERPFIALEERPGDRGLGR